ncbi:hypothetical protein Tco_1340725, partial [Tanacetum coccineum]
VRKTAIMQHVDVLKRIDDPKLMVNDFPMVPLDQLGMDTDGPVGLTGA